MGKVIRREEGCLRRLLAAVWTLTTVLAMEFCFPLSALSLQSSASRKILEMTNTTKHEPLDPPVRLLVNDEKQVVIGNGLIEASFSKPSGFVTGIKYKGIDNVLETKNQYDNRGYWDIVWDNDIFDKLSTNTFEVVTLNDDQVELSFSRSWDSKDPASLPLNVDKRFIVRRGSPGIYIYAIMERGENFPAANMYQIRVVFKLRNTGPVSKILRFLHLAEEIRFDYMAISEHKQRLMPSAVDVDPAHSKVLGYKEAVLLTNPTNPAFRGQVEDKYQYMMENQDIKLHGWISENPSVGVWMITPTNEFRVAGPIKQDLTAHVGPTTLNMFVSTHYAGYDLDVSYKEGETWKMVFGPVLLYLNYAEAKGGNPKQDLWNDANRQMLSEVQSWPYNFPESPNFLKADRRGTVLGQLLVQDAGGSKSVAAGGAYVGLAAPGEPGHWQKDGKGYQFWTRTSEDGKFVIKNVLPGNYNLYGWVPGFIGDYKFERLVAVERGSEINLGSLLYFPPRNGPTLWEIGIPDRTAAEFLVPDPDPKFLNSLIDRLPHEKYRQYGLWQRYAQTYNEHDLVYDIGVSNYGRDWFFAHVTRDLGNSTFKGTTWQIRFKLEVVKKGNYTLQLALASATHAKVHVRVNDPGADSAFFETGRIGYDNAIARHGIHGFYRLYNINIDNFRFQSGSNIIYLTQAGLEGPFSGVMYDYIRLEEPRA